MSLKNGFHRKKIDFITSQAIVKESAVFAGITQLSFLTGQDPELVINCILHATVNIVVVGDQLSDVMEVAVVVGLREHLDNELRGWDHVCVLPSDIYSGDINMKGDWSGWGGDCKKKKCRKRTFWRMIYMYM